MSDLIDRQAAIDAVNEGCQEWRGIFERCEEKLLALPSAQPEHKKGKWIDQDGGAFYTMECSECHKEPLLDEYGDYVQSDFCPHCGADMRGEQDG